MPWDSIFHCTSTYLVCNLVEKSFFDPFYRFSLSKANGKVQHSLCSLCLSETLCSVCMAVCLSFSVSRPLKLYSLSDLKIRTLPLSLCSFFSLGP